MISVTVLLKEIIVQSYGGLGELHPLTHNAEHSPINMEVMWRVASLLHVIILCLGALIIDVSRTATHHAARVM